MDTAVNPINSFVRESAADFVVYISSAPEDDGLQLPLEQKIGGLPGVNVWVDATIGPGENISYNIEQAINDASCLLVLMTSHAVGSPIVWEDLIRADERRLPILVVKEDGVEETQMPRFIRNRRYISFQKSLTREVVEKVARAVLDIREKAVEARLASASKRLIEASKLLSNKPNIEPFRAEIVSNLIERTIEEVHSVLGNRYTIDIGLERAFLLRARPLFENAESVYAVSYDRISGFWKNPNLVEDAREYLRSHQPRTHRLFVFSSQLEAHRYQRILDMHATHYGQTGAVLLCSADAYRQLVDQFLGQKDKLSVLLNKDFGVLDFGNRLVEATLSETSLQFSYVDTGTSGLIKHRNFINLMTELKDLQPGEAHPEYGVLRWDPTFLDQKQRWGDQLTRLFPDPTRDVFHLAFFTHDAVREAGRAQIAAVRDRIAKLKVRPQEIWFGRNRNIDARDTEFGGQLKVNDDYVYGLLMRLSNVQQLAEYQGELAHSEIRKKLYSGFDEGIKSLFQLIEEMPRGDDQRARMFALIEELVPRYMVRMYFVDDADVEGILNEPWYPF